MLAGFESFDSDLDVPVIRSDNTNDFDVVPLEDLAIVTVRVGFAFADSAVVFRSIGVVLIHIANGDDVAKVGVSLGIAGSHTADPDAADVRAIVGGLVGERRLAPGEVRSRRAGGQQRRRLQKITTGGFVLGQVCAI